MKKVIAFLYIEENEKTNKYLTVFKNELKKFEIKTFKELNDNDFKSCEVAIVYDASKEQLDSFYNIVWVQSVRAGIEKLLGQLKDTKINISRLIDNQLSYTMSKSVLAWVYYIQKNMYSYKNQQLQKQWIALEEKENEDTNIAILGLGELGLVSANTLLENDFKVSAWARSQKDVKNIEMYYGSEGLDQILQNADIIVCLLPLSHKTKNLINKEKIQLMKKTASFINFARGPIVDYVSLENSINQNQLQHAILDVFDIEPLDKNSTLWNNKNITILPHISAVTNITTASKIIISNINDYYLQNKTPLFVNKDVGY